MSVLGRIFLALYSLVFIAACIGLGVLAWNDDEQLDLSVGDLNLEALFNTENAEAERWILTLVLGVGVLLGIATLVLALVPWGRRSQALRLKQSDGGEIEVTSSAIEALLRDELERLPEVRTVKPRVKLAGQAVDTDLTVAIQPSASIAHVTSAVTQTTTQVLREQVGAQNIRRPMVRIAYDEVAARPIRSSAVQSGAATNSSTAPPLPPPPAYQRPQPPATETEPPAEAPAGANNHTEEEHRADD